MLGKNREVLATGWVRERDRGALSSQGRGERCGVLSLARKGLSAVKLKARPGRRCRA